MICIMVTQRLPLPQLHFHFNQRAPLQRHHVIFPKAISQLAASLEFEQSHLHLTRGRWRHRQWGRPLLGAKPPGADLEVRWPAVISS